MQDSSPDISQPGYWDQRWQARETAWDIGRPSTPLASYADQLPDKAIQILIPGCGNAYEAEYLLGKGFSNITLLDISSVLVAELTNRLRQHISEGLTILCGDFFEHEGQYDLVLEQTFFCALPPAKREAYASHMYQLLKPGGTLAGLLFNRDFISGPPFGGNLAEYQSLFSPLFSIQKMEPCHNSIQPRSGNELFFILHKYG